MQSTVRFRPPFSYSIFLLILLILIIAGILLKLFLPKREKKKKIVLNKDLYSVKQDYIKLIDLLEMDYKNNRTTTKEAYARLSKIIRSFIEEVTGLNVKSISLSEVKRYNLPYLEDLMREYYVPEFACNDEGNIEKSLSKTREVIKIWR